MESKFYSFIAEFKIYLDAIVLGIKNIVAFINSKPNIATTWALVLTCFVGMLYALFTALLFRETKKQRELTISPFLMVFLKKEGRINRPYVSNLGKGVALNIKFAFPFRTWMEGFGGIGIEKYIHKFDRILYLPPQEEKLLSGVSYYKGEKMDKNIFEDYVLPYEGVEIWPFDKKQIKFIIEYQNSLGSHYFTSFYLGLEGISKVTIAKKSPFRTAFYCAEELIDLIVVNLRSNIKILRKQ